MPYFCDEEYAKRYIGKTISGIKADDCNAVTFDFIDGTSMKLFAYHKSPKTIGFNLHQSFSPEIIVNGNCKPTDDSSKV